MHCKITKKKIEPFMSFGKMPIANGFLNKEDFNLEVTEDLGLKINQYHCL